MGVFKEIPKADGSGITTFYRLDNDKDTVETTSTGGTETMIDYNKALNKPSINNVVLVGNKTLDELGIQPKGDYITEVPSEYITEEELNQKQYATESYVLDKIANIEHFSRQVVDELPLVGKDNVIYLVRKEGAGDDIYNEYIWTGTSYELFGSTATDLSDYYNKDSVNKLLDTKVDKQEGKGLSTNDYTNAEKSKLASLENYDDSELRAAIDSLHNYDDTEIRQEIDKLSNESEAMSEKIEDIDKTNDYKLEAVRLIKSGDYWIWKDSADNLIDYFKARDLLGTENCILIMEQLDSDGKSIPADYKIDGDRIRILYKDLENLNHEMYMGPPDKDEVEGTDIVIDNGAEATLFALSGDGASEQVTTTGKNLYNYEDTIAVGNDITVDEEGYITISYDNSQGESTVYKNYFTNPISLLKANTNYSFFAEVKSISGQGYFAMTSSDATSSVQQFNIPSIRTSIDFTDINNGEIIKKDYTSKENLNDSTINIGVRTFVGFDAGESGSITFRISLLEDTSVTSESFVYEPYTDGQPSPSPDYPQEISSIEGNLEFNCRGKNLVDYRNIHSNRGLTVALNDNGSVTITGTPTGDIDGNYVILLQSYNIDNILKDGETYTLSQNIPAFIYLQVNAIPKRNGSILYITSSNSNTEKSKTFTVDKSNYTYSVGIQSGLEQDVGENINLTLFFQLEQGSQATEYEPYQGQTYDIDLQGNEMVELPNGVKDELVIDKYGNVSLIKNVGKIILDGSEDENWKLDTISSGTDIRQFSIIFGGVYTNNTGQSPTLLSDYFQGVIWDNSWLKNNTVTPYKYGNSSGLRLYSNQFEDVNALKTWLSSHNTAVYYTLETPQTIPLGTLSAGDLAKLSTFDGYNNLFINTNLGYMNIRVTYSTNTNYNENIILGDDSYYYGIVDNKQSLPEGKAKGTLCQTKDTKDFYIYNGEEWVPVDKTASFDLSNYLSKDNTTPYSPSDRYNPATKQYVDTNIQGLRIPTKVSQLENDSNYITENTNTLVNYYNKNNTYNKKEVDALIDSSGLTPVSVTLNGQKTTDANFYAPASGGTANQILVSQGDTAPVWQNNTAVQTVNQDIKLVISDTQPEAPSSGFILWVDSTK